MACLSRETPQGVAIMAIPSGWLIIEKSRKPGDWRTRAKQALEQRETGAPALIQNQTIKARP